MSEATDTHPDIYDEALNRLGRQGTSYENAYGVYGAQLARAAQAYERMAVEARVNKALAELDAQRTDSAAGITAKAAGRTIGQRSKNSLMNTLGSISRQYKDYREDAQHALGRLEIQKAAQEESLAYSREAQESANRLSQQRYDSELNIQRDYLKLNKENSDFNKAYQLYLMRYFDPGRFKKMTGITVKKLPVPRKPPNLFADLKAMLTKEGKLVNGKPPQECTAADWVKYLEAHKDEIIKKYGSGQFDTAFSYYSMKSYDAQFGGLTDRLKLLDDMIGLLGTNKEPDVYKFYNGFNKHLRAAWDELNAQCSG